ncbi:TIGR03915 family putative DNA repair protein [Sphingobacterium sp. DN00404]|uniref:TIGR03915 family putative DNA repair protein n=1 Tax=Sphingobacterium micropteri TaxID=2763501 RepID=A0ABR7YUG1_9SPHI|nr:TIGR03915 family putative DNA repair protein [Sphingobacterium micropteri]MBD1434803.1 TIGR03915 family putative DNA repair protein [Sphingobacterium micropteri]
MYYLFDGTYLGFLSCVFESFERKEAIIVPITPEDHQIDFFKDRRIIVTDKGKALRVQKGLQERVGKVEAMDFYRAFLSEDRKAWLASFFILRQIFIGRADIRQHYGNDHVLYFSQILKKVSRERHRMKAFIRFSKSSDGLFFALVEPDFNVLPLISDFFRKRYADMPWLIYDIKRKYGLLFDKRQVGEVQLSSEEVQGATTPAIAIALDERDQLFQRLWKQYYTSTNIEARKNMKLHLQHVPRRYWKYLVEKK